jgi:type II secretory pathway pseudopilin PulG
MWCKSRKTRCSRALTLLELVVAISMMTVVLMALLPALAGVRHSWEARQANAEVLQNARVLIDHVSRHLSTAARIADVSMPSEAMGYVEYVDHSGHLQRYAVDANGFVQFGPPDDGADLAGPVSRLQFACYDGNDLVTPIPEPGLAQLVTLTVTFPTGSDVSKDKRFSCSVYIRSAAVLGKGKVARLDGDVRIHADLATSRWLGVER